jgi:hypothetical protein
MWQNTTITCRVLASVVAAGCSSGSKLGKQQSQVHQMQSEVKVGVAQQLAFELDGGICSVQLQMRMKGNVSSKAMQQVAHCEQKEVKLCNDLHISH